MCWQSGLAKRSLSQPNERLERFFRPHAQVAFSRQIGTGMHYESFTDLSSLCNTAPITFVHRIRERLAVATSDQAHTRPYSLINGKG